MDFNKFYISGIGNKCLLQVSYLLVCFTCDVNITSCHFYDIDELRQRLLHVWRGLEQSLIDDVVDQWPTRLCMLVFIPTVNIFNIPCDCQFVSSILDELYVSHHA